MPIDMAAYGELRRRFLANRANFPMEELAKYMGKWVAFSPDGSRILASATDPGDPGTGVRREVCLYGSCGPPILELLDIQLLGARRETLVVPNVSFSGISGQHTTRP